MPSSETERYRQSVQVPNAHSASFSERSAQRALVIHVRKSNTVPDSQSSSPKPSISATAVRFSVARPSCQFKDSADVGNSRLERSLMLPAGMPELRGRLACSRLYGARPDSRPCMPLTSQGWLAEVEPYTIIPLGYSSSAFRYQAAKLPLENRI